MLDQWSNYFVMVGGGAAALFGLISAPTSMRRSTSWRPDWPCLRGEARGLLRPVNREPNRETGPYTPARRESRSK